MRHAHAGERCARRSFSRLIGSAFLRIARVQRRLNTVYAGAVVEAEGLPDRRQPRGRWWPSEIAIRRAREVAQHDARSPSPTQKLDGRAGVRTREVGGLGRP